MYFDVAAKTFREENIEADKIAFVAADKNLLWSELKNLSEKICEVLKQTGIPKGSPVLVHGDREAFFLAAILACYQMGLPFVPINNLLPKKRIEKILEQTQAEVMIVAGADELAVQTPIIIKSDFSVEKKGVADFIKTINAAYILFTSGSSGEPKGVVITDKNICSFTHWFVDKFPVSKQTVFINQAGFLFDIALADFFGGLQLGSTVIFNTTDVANNPDVFYERVNRYKGSYLNTTPSFGTKYLADKNFTKTSLPYLTHFVFIGESLSNTLVRELKKRFSNATIINAYGPTEATIYVSFVEVTDDILTESTAPICHIDNDFVSIDNDELIISGGNVGAGYLNNEALSKQKFFEKEGKKFFRTGDLARVKNNYVYYTGRKDEQVKLNGYRIELNEIKQAIERIEFIEQAECLPIVIEEKVKRIIAFVKTKQTGDTTTIKKLLEQELPVYMIPSEVVVVSEFPYTVSHKVDKQQLLSNYLAL